MASENDHTTIDATIVGGGTIVQIRLNTVEARNWVKEHVDAPDYMWMGEDVLCVEHRYADAILNGMIDAGLEIE